MKKESVFYRKDILSRIRENAKGGRLLKIVTDQAERWLGMSCDDLYSLIFPSSMQRAYMVFSSGWCPECRKPVAGYSWIIDSAAHPWKLKCPFCDELFPKNDFKAFYDSGIDEHGLFKYVLADKRLLLNEEHPEIGDPKRRYGVDDGYGYNEGANTWYFIGKYLLTGIWEDQILAGIVSLSDAYALTGDIEYARKAAVLMDRTADIFPEYDFTEQGVINDEHHTSRGYVSYWCNSAYEVLRLALAYDSIFEAVKDDKEFIGFATAKSRENDTPVKKRCFEDIQRNIEERLLLDPVRHRWKIESNRPRTHFAIMAAKAVTGWPENRDEVIGDLWDILDIVTKVDGLSGEKGLGAYSALSAYAVSNMISCMSLLEEGFFAAIMERYPVIHYGYRFFLDTFCIQKYYPGCGDMGRLGMPRRYSVYPGLAAYERNDKFEKTVLYSHEGFLWRLYQETGDADFLRMFYNIPDSDTVIGNLFESTMTADLPPAEMRKKAADIIEKTGTHIEPKDTNRETWKLAVCHSGGKGHERAFALDYDSGGYHGHNDCMNLSIFAKGLDLLPDYGYPPHHRKGGWNSGWFFWYRSASSHNTVIVDRKEHADYLALNEKDYDRKKDPIGYYNYVKNTYTDLGKTEIWAAGEGVKLIRASCPEVTQADIYERTIAMIDISEKDSYFADIFRVKGGSEHIKLIRSSHSELAANGIDPVYADEEAGRYGTAFIKEVDPDRQIIHYNFDSEEDNCFTRNIRKDRNPDPGWSVEWKMKDIYWQKTDGRDIYLKYTDLTDGCEAWLYEARFDIYGEYVHFCPEKLGGKELFPDTWLPAAAVVKKGEDLESVFAGIFEPYEGKPFIKYSKRLPVTEIETGKITEAPVAIEVGMENGIADMLLFSDTGGKAVLQDEWEVETDAAFCAIRKRGGKYERISVFGGTYTNIKGISCSDNIKNGFVQVDARQLRHL